MPKIRVQFPVGPLLQTVLWSNGDDTCLTNRKRWFDSIQDYFNDAMPRYANRRSGPA